MIKEAKIGQRAQREATGYYCGYTFKRQPVGRHALEATSQTLDFVEASLKGRTEGQQWHRVSNRVLQDLQHRCMVRPTTEEFNLAVNAHEQDVTNAEFIRTYMSQAFFGGQLLRRLEAVETAAESTTALRRIPIRKGNVEDAAILMRLFAESYGLRGRDMKVHFLNP